MGQDMSASDSAMPEQPGRRKAWIIILIIAIVLCCLCLAAAIVLAWYNGDAALQWVNQLLGSTSY